MTSDGKDTGYHRVLLTSPALECTGKPCKHTASGIPTRSKVVPHAVIKTPQKSTERNPKMAETHCDHLPRPQRLQGA